MSNADMVTTAVFDNDNARVCRARGHIPIPAGDATNIKAGTFICRRCEKQVTEDGELVDG